MATQIIPTWTLGDRLTKARDTARLTNNEMAEELGLSRNTITNWETDHIKPKRYAVEAWARICGVDVDWLLGDDFSDTAAAPAGRPVAAAAAGVPKPTRAAAGRRAAQSRCFCSSARRPLPAGGDTVAGAAA